MTTTPSQKSAAQSGLTAAQTAAASMSPGPAVTTFENSLATSTTDLNKIQVTTVPPTLVLTPVANQSLVVGKAFSLTLKATGGTTPYKWGVTTILPAGLTLNASTGVISGTPTAVASTPTTVTVTDSGSPAQKQAESFTIAVAAVAPPPPTGLLPLGSYEDPSGSIPKTTAFGVETGCKMSVRTEYLTQGASDTWMGDLNYILGMWKGSPYKMCLGIPLVPYAYPAVFAPAASLVPLHQQMAAAMVASGVGINSLRLNWELNIGTCNDFKTDVAGGIAAWKLIVPIYQEAGFLIEINTVPQQYWDVITLVHTPLLGFYDIVSCDPYFQSYAKPFPNNQPNTPGNTSADVWATIHGGVDGLDALATFARAHDLAFGFAECGVGNKTDANGSYGTGDDPNGIAMYAQWIGANLDLFLKPGGYMSYFDDFPTGFDTILANFPNAEAEFQKVFPPLVGA